MYGLVSTMVVYLHYLCLPVFFQVLSHNLCTALCIAHDKQALEVHFRDDDDGPVSSQGYMPYLNMYILDKVLSKTSIHLHLA